MVINTNLAAQTGARLLAASSSLLAKSLGRLSSGSKLNSPEDDAAGLAVALRFDSQVSRINAARANLGNAISFSQTQDGYLKKVGQALDRMGELAILARDATKTDQDRALYDAEFQKLLDYVQDLQSKNFNGIDLFNGDALVVTTDGEGATMNMVRADFTTDAYADLLGSSIDDLTNAEAALENIKAATEQLAADRGDVGANIATLTAYQDQLGILKDNLTAATSRIRDVDVAEESANFAKYNILVQAGTAMLAQANQTPQNMLRLLQ